MQGVNRKHIGKRANREVYSWDEFLGTVECFLTWPQDLDPVSVSKNSRQSSKLQPNARV